MDFLKLFFNSLLLISLVLGPFKDVFAIYNGQRIDEIDLDPAQFESILMLSGGGDHRASATHIGNGMILTARHVWDQIQRLNYFTDLEIGGARGEVLATVPKDELEIFLPNEISNLELQRYTVKEPDVAILVPTNPQVRRELAKLPTMLLYRPEVSPLINSDYLSTISNKTDEQIFSETEIIHRGDLQRFLASGYGFISLKRERNDGSYLHVGEIMRPYVDPEFLRLTGRPIAIEASGTIESAFPDLPKARNIEFSVTRPGDSGGPLLQVIEGTLYQIGIASSSGLISQETGRFDPVHHVEIMRYRTKSTWSSTDTPEFMDLVRRVRQKYSNPQPLLATGSPKDSSCYHHFLN